MPCPYIGKEQGPRFCHRPLTQATVAITLLLFVSGCQSPPEGPFDLVLQGGHVIDAKNSIDEPMDVGITEGKIAAVYPGLPTDKAEKVVDVSGLYVTPGLIDLHVHVYAGTGTKALTGDSSVYPDDHSFRSGVTTMVDVGTSGHRNFEDFKDHVIDRAKTRVLVMLNVAGGGMGPDGEDNIDDMEPDKIAAMAKKYPEIIVGIKTAHYGAPDWTSVERAVEAGKLADIPVMVDFGTNHPERPLTDLVTKKLRPGDIYTHMYSGRRDELIDGKVNPGLFEGRKRGVTFDVGHGGGSFYWYVAAPSIDQGFPPDSISTDLHIGSMNGGMKDMANTVSKFLALGVPLADVIRMSTWNPAQQIKRPDLGHLTVGAVADVAVLRAKEGKVGFLDSSRQAVAYGDKLLVPELTLKDGAVQWDLNGIAGEDWETFYSREEEPVGVGLRASFTPHRRDSIASSTSPMLISLSNGSPVRR